ncbi:unnamed protein product [Cyprideis torosa]|uniref:Uncharacterized protein n=1 Tax=Cyprideis torosa TaxID=163714 RepID=A0A7R8W9E4_9CRUS|nr:unnamed protein product [Cyprideis torosa]CAG0884299.1 unnamed protein product [Cyprideis torosa]
MGTLGETADHLAMMDKGFHQSLRCAKGRSASLCFAEGSSMLHPKSESNLQMSLLQVEPISLAVPMLGEGEAGEPADANLHPRGRPKTTKVKRAQSAKPMTKPVIKIRHPRTKDLEESEIGSTEEGNNAYYNPFIRKPPLGAPRDNDTSEGPARNPIGQSGLLDRVRHQTQRSPPSEISGRISHMVPSVGRLVSTSGFHPSASTSQIPNLPPTSNQPPKRGSFREKRRATGLGSGQTPEGSPSSHRRTQTVRGGTPSRLIAPEENRVVRGGSFRHVRPTQWTDEKENADVEGTPLRNFVLSSKGLVNKGDSFRRKNSRSNSLPLSELREQLRKKEERNSSATGGQSHTGSAGQLPPLKMPPHGMAVEAEPTTSSPQRPAPSQYRVAVIGCQGVGKSALITQFMSSECINVYDRQNDAENLTVQVNVNGEESELEFVPSTGTPHEVRNRREIRVAVIGCQGVGKSALITQFMSSECINVYDRQNDAENLTVQVNVNGEESELEFVPSTGTPHELDPLLVNPPDALIFQYSVTDGNSLQRVEDALSRLHACGLTKTRATVVVGNKTDLVRSRVVSPQDGKSLAISYKCKWVEISVACNHNVDQLLVGLVNQIQLYNKKRLECPTAPTPSVSPSKAPTERRRGIVRASKRIKRVFSKVWKGEEDKNCEDFHLL